MTFGYEIEWGNVPKDVTPPSDLAVWEGNGKHCEIDVMNYSEKEGWKASSPVDPLGGEMNMIPQSSIKELTENFRILSTEIFPNHVIAPISHGHAHVRVDWMKDVKALKEFTLWCHEHYQEIIDECYPTPELSKDLVSGLRRYFKWDGGAKFSRPMVEKVKNAKTLEDIINSDRRGNTTMRNARAFINITGIRNSNTIEFRCFRMPATVDQFYDQMKFVEGIMNKKIIKGLNLPKFDPGKLTENPDTIKALNEGYSSREERKKLGKKVRLEWK